MHLRFAPIALPVLAVALTGVAQQTPPSAAPAAPPAAAGPQIVAAAINPDPIHPGSHVEADVETSPDVTEVDAHVHGMHFHLDQVQPGRFRAEGTVPKFARFFKGTYHVTFVAHCSAGTTVESGEDVVLN